NDQLRLAQYFGDAGQELTVIELYSEVAQAQLGQCLVVDKHEFGLVDQAVGPHHVHVTLIKLTVAPSLWPVGAPYGLYLEPLERQGKLMLVHYHVTGERNRKVIA